jgi:hypothetical protein
VLLRAVCSGIAVGFVFVSDRKKQNPEIEKRFQDHSALFVLLASRLYCRLRNLTESCLAARGLREFSSHTTGRDFHPALKNILFCIQYTDSDEKSQVSFQKNL